MSFEFEFEVEFSFFLSSFLRVSRIILVIDLLLLLRP